MRFVHVTAHKPFLDSDLSHTLDKYFLLYDTGGTQKYKD